MDVRSHLPITPFIGREGEIEQISVLLHDPACRLLTLVGAGGVGKTRLALEAASRTGFEDGAGFVALQPLNTADMIVPTTAEVVGFKFSSSLPPRQQLLNYLHDKTLMLVLDNLEHLIDDDETVSLLVEILARAQGVKILATSREILHIQGEWVFEVNGLPYPPSDFDGDLASFSAVQLFTQHARRIRRSFSLEHETAGIVRICELVRGTPLALELAAAWVRTLTCDEIADEIAGGIDILETDSRDVPTRHRSMRVTLEHSWNRLTTAEQAAFSQLSIFRGGFTRDAAQTVTGAPLRTLAALVNKSWLRWTISTGRYEVHELLRQFGEEKLATDEAEKTRSRYAYYYAAFLEREYGRLIGPDIRASIETIEADLDNVRLAWNWAVEQRNAALLTQAMHGLWFFYDLRSLLHEGERAFREAAESLRSEDELAYAKILARLGHFYFALDKNAKGYDVLQHSLEIFEHHEPGSSERAYALMVMGQLIANVNEHHKSLDYFEQSLAICKTHGDVWNTAAALTWVGYKYQHIDQPQKSWGVLQECLTICEEIGSPFALAGVYKALIVTAIDLSKSDEALEYALKALALYRELGIPWGISDTYNLLGSLFGRSGKLPQAMMYLYHAFESVSKFFLPHQLSLSLIHLARGWIDLGRNDQAGIALALYIEWNSRFVSRPQAVKTQLDAFAPLLPYDSIEAGLSLIRAGNFHVELKKALETLRQYVESHAAPEPQAIVTQRAPNTLTGREREILRLVAAGHSNREIADKLVYSHSTVKWYLNQIYGKLHVGSRTQAIARAHELKLFA